MTLGFSLAEYIETQSWRPRAACIGEDSEVFFRDPDEGRGNWDASKAIEICEGCTVRQECLDYAIDLDIQYGIWGGLRPSHRIEYAAGLCKGERPPS